MANVKGTYANGGNTNDFQISDYSKEQVSIANNQIAKLSNILNWTSAYSPFVKFAIGKSIGKENKDNKYSMEFDTLSGLGESGSFGARNDQRHYLLSIEMQKKGLDSANAWKVRIVFLPDLASGNITDDVSESLLGKLEYNRRRFSAFDKSILFKNCEIQYGYYFPNYIDQLNDKYGIKNSFLLTPVYRGQILNYTMEILNGYIVYELECISGIYSLKEITLDESNLLELAGGTANPIKLVKKLLEKYIESSGLDYEVVDNISGTVGVCLDGNSKSNQYVIFNDKNTPKGTHIIDYINLILSKTVASGQWDYYTKKSDLENILLDEEASDSEKKEAKDKLDKLTVGKTNGKNFIKFHMVVEDCIRDGETKPKIILDYEPKNSVNPEDNEVDFDFEWLRGDKLGLVINFQPTFYGSVFMANMDGIVNYINEKTDKIWGARTFSNIITDNGDLETIKKEQAAEKASYDNAVDTMDNGNAGSFGMSLGILLTGGLEEPGEGKTVEDISDSIDASGMYEALTMDKAIEFFGTNEQLYASIVQAKLQTLGIPAHIPLLTTLRVTPIINNTIHFSAGDYNITTITDIISSQGFQTSFDLMRKVDDRDEADMFRQWLESNNPYGFSEGEIDSAIKDYSYWEFFENVTDSSGYYESNYNAVEELVAQGYSREEAQTLAPTWYDLNH